MKTIFVFGSNLAGRHGAGSALAAYQTWGAKLGVGVGLQGNCYAIPTKDENLNILSLDEIKPYVDSFMKFVEANSNLSFLITEIGCGLAGYTSKEIAPLFKEAVKYENCTLPYSFYDTLNIPPIFQRKLESVWSN